MNITCASLSVSWLQDKADRKSEIWNNKTEFSEKKFYAIIAPSGTGKTTFVQLLYGLIREHGGTVTADERICSELDHFAWALVRREEIAILFQDLRLFENLTGLENIELKNRLCGYFTSSEIREKAEALGIDTILDRSCASYSLGEKQRLAFLRSLCQPFKWILLDEPFSHVDDENKKIMVTMLLSRVKKSGAGIIGAFLGPEPAIKWDREISL